MSDFQQTVDLREQMEKRRRETVRRAVGPIEEIYQTQPTDEPVRDMKTINRPAAAGGAPRRAFTPGLLILAGLFAIAVIYFSFFSHRAAPAGGPKNENWYAVKLVDGEIIYGQILDVKTDPVVMTNVYYNYDQTQSTGLAKDQTKTIGENGLTPASAGNLRLVKRGKETQGGDGSMNIVRGQVLYMEPLKSDSKVLKAILEYEK